MKKSLLLFACAMLCGFGIEAKESPARVAQNAALSFLARCDSGDYAGAYANSSNIVHGLMPADLFARSLGSVRDPLGKVVSRKYASAKELTSLPGAPDGHYVMLTFNTQFARQKAAVETVTPALENGVWKVSGYFIR